jgi:hypothetical protein
MPDGTTETNNALADREPCDWKFQRWDSEWVTCTLKKDHVAMANWPFHAPNMPVIKPWKQTVKDGKRTTE